MGFVESSPATFDYNCIAWAAGETNRWWWPDPEGQCYWPSGIPRQVTLEAFVQAYGTLGYEPCESDSPGFNVEKVAIYANDQGEIKHAARQLLSGKWTSKLGELVDIEHDALQGDYPHYCAYGHVVSILARPRL